MNEVRSRLMTQYWLVNCIQCGATFQLKFNCFSFAPFLGPFPYCYLVKLWEAVLDVWFMPVPIWARL